MRFWLVLLAGLSAMPLVAQEPPACLFVAVGYGGRRIASEDGVVWKHDQRWADEARNDDHVLFNIAYGKGRFIAVGGVAAVGHILSTRDGKEWKALAPGLRGRVATIAFGSGRFVAGHDSELLCSTDGETFFHGAKILIPGSIHAGEAPLGMGKPGRGM